MPTRQAKKLIALALGLIVLGSLWFYAAPASLGGSTTYVVTNGVSMEPRFHTGDLAIVRAQSSYHVGEIVAYHNKMFHTIVLHRIVGREGDRYLFKGDNNNFVDFEHPLASQLIGSLRLHVAGAGADLKSIRSPALVGGLVAVGMLLLCGAAFTRNRRRRRRHARTGEGLEQRPPRASLRPAEPVVGVLAVGIVALVPFVVLALLAFTRPSTALRPFTIPFKQTGTFSYSAVATPGPAYPGNHVVTGEPLFTHVLDKVNLRFGYRFATAVKHSLTGKASLVATLTSTSGWHTTLPLGAPAYFRGDHGSVKATLDLPALVALMQRVEDMTRVPGTYKLTITPHVSTSASLDLVPLHATFTPAMTFSLSELEIQPTEGGSGTGTGSSTNSQFTPSASGSATGKHYEPLFLSVKIARTTVATARAIALGGFAVVLLALLAIAALVRPRPRQRQGQRDETAAIRSRYGRLIVPVARVSQLPGVAVIDVSDIDALARIAEHYDRSILHEHAEDGDAFWVTDESGHFRYALQPGATEIRAATQTPAPAAPQGLEAIPAPAWAEGDTTELPVVTTWATRWDDPPPASSENGAVQPANEPTLAENEAALPANEPVWTESGAAQPANEPVWTENGAAQPANDPVWTEYGAAEQASELAWAQNGAEPAPAPTAEPEPEPAWPVEGEILDPSAADALANEVYADELELGGVFTASGAQPAPAENVPAEEAERERWQAPDEAPTFVQEAGTTRAPGESSGVSRTRAGAVVVHVTGF
ncbi:MAG: hypothetical protein JWN10_1211 [Solirubrobacterales bacterium]|nr:hypothetical protein [Solirubrobacterales bacterium]